MNVTKILLTHGHFDHIYGVNYIIDEFPHAEVMIHAADLHTYKNQPQLIKKFGISYDSDGLYNGQLTALQNGTVIQLGNEEITLINTPGHTPGSSLFFTRVFDEKAQKVQKVLFTGDTLFLNSYGRTDLPGGDATAMKKSLKFIRETYRDKQIRFYPGHGQGDIL